MKNWDWVEQDKKIASCKLGKAGDYLTITIVIYNLETNELEHSKEAQLDYKDLNGVVSYDCIKYIS